MLTAAARLLAEVVRVTVIVALSVAAGLGVALAGRNIEGDVLEVLALFATFAAPVSVAWLLFRTIPPLRSQAANAPVICGPDKDNDSQDANHGQPPS